MVVANRLTKDNRAAMLGTQQPTPLPASSKRVFLPAQKPDDATVKYQDRAVEVLSGRVVMTEDGTMVDNGRSDGSIVIRDLATGKVEMVSPDAILTYEEYAAPATREEAGSMPSPAEESAGDVQPQSQYASGQIKIRNSDGTETRGVLTGYIDEDGKHEYYVEGDLQRLHYATDHELDNILSEYVPDEPQPSDEPSVAVESTPSPTPTSEPSSTTTEAPQDDVAMPTGVNPVGSISMPQQDGSTRTFTVGKDAEGQNVVIDDRGFMWAHDGNGNSMQPYSPGANVPMWSDEQLAKLGTVQPINEQPSTAANQSEGVPNVAENRENGVNVAPETTENAVSEPESTSNSDVSVENVQQVSALSRIPVDEKSGEPIFEHAPDHGTAWDGLVEAVGSDARAADIAKAQVDNITAELTKLTGKQPKLTGSPMQMAAQQKEYQEKIDALRGRLEAWNGIVAVDGVRRVEAERAKREAELQAELKRQEQERKAQREAERQRKLEETADNLSQYRKAIMGWGEPLSLREYLLRALLSGVKLRWSNSKAGSHGMAGHLFGNRSNHVKKFTGEYGKMKWMVDDVNGMAPETFAERVCQDYYNDFEQDTDHSSEVFNELLDVLMLGTPKGMWDELNDMRKQISEDEYYGMTEEEMEAEQAWRDRYGMNEEAWLSFEESNGDFMDMTDDEYREFIRGIADGHADKLADERAERELYNEVAIEYARQQQEEFDRMAVDGASEAESAGSNGGALGSETGVYNDRRGSTAWQEGAAEVRGDVRQAPAGFEPAGVAGDTRGVGEGSGDMAAQKRPLSKEEAQSLVTALTDGAEDAVEIPLTIENWDALFGENGAVSTPIENVVMGENQFVKLCRLGRNGKLGMVKPTLENPDIVVEEQSQAKDGQISERDSSRIYIKSFIDKDGNRIYHFTSVTIKRDGTEIVISNQEKSPNRIANLLQKGSLLWVNTQKFEIKASLASETQKQSEVSAEDSQSTTQTSFADSLGINSSKTSADKGNASVSEKQAVEDESSEDYIMSKMKEAAGRRADEILEIAREDFEEQRQRVDSIIEKYDSEEEIEDKKRLQDIFDGKIEPTEDDIAYARGAVYSALEEAELLMDDMDGDGKVRAEAAMAFAVLDRYAPDGLANEISEWRNREIEDGVQRRIKRETELDMFFLSSKEREGGESNGTLTETERTKFEKKIGDMGSYYLEGYLDYYEGSYYKSPFRDAQVKAIEKELERRKTNKKAEEAKRVKREAKKIAKEFQTVLDGKTDKEIEDAIARYEKRSERSALGDAQLEIAKKELAKRRKNSKKPTEEQKAAGNGAEKNSTNAVASKLFEAIETIYGKGREVANQMYQRSFFDVAKTPDFMKQLGLSGEKFTIRYGVIARHLGKDSDHNLPMEVWRQIPEALQHPFAISKHFEADKTGEMKQKGFRIYLSVEHNGRPVIIGATVKSSGPHIEVNSIDTVFAITRPSEYEEFVYQAENITPKQQSLLDGRNSHQYPATRESSAGKGNASVAEKQASDAESSYGYTIDRGSTAGQERTEANNGIDPRGAGDRIKSARLRSREGLLDVYWGASDESPSILVQHPSSFDLAYEIKFDGEEWVVNIVPVVVEHSDGKLSVSVVPVEERHKLDTKLQRMIKNRPQPAMQRDIVAKYVSMELREYFECGEAYEDNKAPQGVGAKERVYNCWGIVYAKAGSLGTDNSMENVFDRYNAQMSTSAERQRAEAFMKSKEANSWDEVKDLFNEFYKELLLDNPGGLTVGDRLAIFECYRVAAERFGELFPKDILTGLNNSENELRGWLKGVESNRRREKSFASDIAEMEDDASEYSDEELAEEIATYEQARLRYLRLIYVAYSDRLRHAIGVGVKNCPILKSDSEGWLKSVVSADLELKALYKERESRSGGAQFSMGNKKTPVAGQPNRANEKQASGSVLKSSRGDSSSNGTASKKALAKVLRRTQSTKRKIKDFFNGDFVVQTDTLQTALNGLGRMLSMRVKGGSRYALLHTNAGQTVEVRISNHIATGNNFAKEDADSNLSIVIEDIVLPRKESQIRYTEATIPLSTYEANPQAVVTAIVKGVEDVLADKPFTLDECIGRVEEKGGDASTDGQFSIDERREQGERTELAHKAVMECLRRCGIEVVEVTQAEALAKAAGAGVDVLETGAGVVYGWTENGRIFLSPEGLDAETPAHEYTHLWVSAMMKSSPKAWSSIVKLLKGTTMWEDVVNDPLYAKERSDDNAVASEMLSRLSGKKAKEYFEREAEKMAHKDGILEQARVTGMIDRVRRAVSRFWTWVANNLFGIKKFKSIDEVTDRVLYDLTSGTRLDRGDKEAEKENAGTSKIQDAAQTQLRDGIDKSFAERQRKAVADRGTVTPGLADMKIEVVNVPRHDFGGTGKQAIEKARRWALENLKGYHVAKEGTSGEYSYHIDNDAIGKYLSQSSTTQSENLGVHLAVLKQLPQIINSSVDAEVHANYRKGSGARAFDNGLESNDILIHRLYGAAVIDGKLYRIKTTLKEFNGDQPNQPYNYQVTKLELLISGSETSNALSNSSSITGAKLLEGVEKSYEPGKKLLPDEGLLYEPGSEHGASTDGDIRFRDGKKMSEVERFKLIYYCPLKFFEQ